MRAYNPATDDRRLIPSFSTSVAHLGTYGEVAITEPALQATAQLLGWKLSLHGVPCEGQVAITSGVSPSPTRPRTPETLTINPS